jgi:hypothetical protein
MSSSSSPALIEIVLNICIFTRPKLRLILCSWYFLASTCSSLIALYMGCLTRVLTSFSYNPQTTLGTIIYCKVRTCLTYASLSLSICLIIRACADGWVSSVGMRSFSSVKIVKRVIIGVILTVYLVYGQILYCFNGGFQLNTANCQPILNTCELYNDFE